MISKKGFEFSFGWIFALIVGAAILALASYGAVKLVGSERSIQSAENAVLLGTLLSPLESSSEDARALPAITFPTETRIYNGCVSSGNFGEQRIALSISSGIGTKWPSPGVNSTFYSKYIFSGKIIEGKQLYTFSKPFYSPFKVGTLTFAWSEKEKYCFVKAPRAIAEEITDLQLININVSDSVRNCPSKSTTVCFASTGCSIDVTLDPRDPENGVVRKNKSILTFTGPLIYGAILGDPEVYECQVKRIYKRTGELSLIYAAKSDYTAARLQGCSSALQPSLLSYANITSKTNASRQINDFAFLKDDLKRQNDNLGCQLWEGNR